MLSRNDDVDSRVNLTCDVTLRHSTIHKTSDGQIPAPALAGLPVPARRLTDRHSRTEFELPPPPPRRATKNFRNYFRLASPRLAGRNQNYNRDVIPV